jgi:hypothetical protein
MLRLPTTPTPLPAGGLRAVLRTLGAADEFGNPAPAYTGRIVVKDPNARANASFYLRSGRIYAATLSGFTPPVALRLLSGGLLSAAAYADLHELTPDLVGPTAISRGYATADDVEDVHRQMLLATLTHVYAWGSATWRWEDGAVTDAFTITGIEVNLIVAASDERVGQWEALARNYPLVTKGSAIPFAGPEWSAKAGESTSPEIASILRYVDGETTIGQIAVVCGFARFEIAARLAKAIADGILVIDDPDHPLTPSASAAQAADVDASWLNELDEATREVDHARERLAEAEARLVQARARAASN